MTFEEAVGRVFSFENKKFYVAKGYRRPWNTTKALSVPYHIGQFSEQWVLVDAFRGEINYHALVIDLETSTEVVIYENGMNHKIPEGWNEILP